MKIGSNDVAGVKLGSQDVARIYQGSNVAWEPSGTTGLDFVSVWRTTADNEEIVVPTQSGTYDYIIDWGDGSPTEHITSSSQPSHIYATAGDYTITISGKFAHIDFLQNNTSKDNIIEIVSLGDVGWESFEQSFYFCDNLTTINPENTQAYDGLNFHYMFSGIGTDTSFATVQLENMKVTGDCDLTSMFNGAYITGALNFSGFQNVSATGISSLFKSCDEGYTVSNLEGIDVTNITFFDNMFSRAGESDNPIDLSNSGFSGVPSNPCGMGSMFLYGFFTNVSVPYIDGAVPTAVNQMFQAFYYNFDNIPIETMDYSQCTSFVDFISYSYCSTSKYDAVLIQIESTNSMNDLILGAHGINYTPGGEAEAARQALLDRGWTINDAGPAGAINPLTVNDSPSVTGFSTSYSAFEMYSDGSSDINIEVFTDTTNLDHPFRMAAGLVYDIRFIYKVYSNTVRLEGIRNGEVLTWDENHKDLTGSGASVMRVRALTNDVFNLVIDPTMEFHARFDEIKIERVIGNGGDIDNNGSPDDVILNTDDVTITQDEDSINIDLDGDGDADIIIPKG